jgi:hypothetical protein
MIRSLFWISLIFVVTASAPDKLVKTKIGDRITVSLPPTLFAMTPEDIAQRFPSVRAPLGAFTNEERVVDFSVNVSATQWPDGDIEVARKFFKAALFNLYDKVDLIEEGVHEVHKNRFIFFEMETRVNANRRVEGGSEPILKYTYIQYLVRPGETLVFSFNCPRAQRMEWQETARQVMKTVRVK